MFYERLQPLVKQWLVKKSVDKFNFCFYGNHLSIRVRCLEISTLTRQLKIRHRVQPYPEKLEVINGYCLASQLALFGTTNFPVRRLINAPGERLACFLHGLFNNLSLDTMDEGALVLALSFLKFRKLARYEARYEGEKKGVGVEA